MELVAAYFGLGMELDLTIKNDPDDGLDTKSEADPVSSSKSASNDQTDPTKAKPSSSMAGEKSSSEPIASVKKVSRFKTAGRRMSQLMFSSLTRRIIFLNLSALAVLLSGILYLNQFREGLVEAYKDSLVAQGKIIAGAISASATIEINSITVDPDKLLELEAGESSTPTITSLDDLSSPIDPEIVAPLVRSLVQPNRTRARIYDQDGVLILDSKFLYAGGQVLRFDLPDPKDEIRWWSSSALGNFLNRILQRRDLPTYEEHPHSGIHYPEVVSALTGAPSTIVRMTKKGEQVISVAVPIQRLRIVSGVLLLSSEGNEIDKIVTQERLAILRIFLVAAIVLIVLSVLMASTIATPLRRLSDAANRVRKGVESREEIPDFSSRHDEIGTLSTSIREMTNALYLRIEAIEKFAADVSHELKNPLTSLRSAVETLPLAKTDESKRRLHEVIQHDVRRLDRLITDISDASRLDAELVREKAGIVDIAKVVENIIEMARESRKGKPDIKIDLNVDKAASDAYLLTGHEGRLAQVIINLIDNAKSFVSPENGAIHVNLSKQAEMIDIIVSDNGPGISAEKVDRVFERFYTDRPVAQGFGQNSGLGLSISRQIIEAHGGEITVRNKTGKQSGAVFHIKLPPHNPSSESGNRRSSISKSNERNS
jgi:two-component system sensor histidine kinase ChvG